MNRLTTFLSTSVFLIFHYTATSQALEDAIRFSILDFGSTARSAGVGGAFSALGADIAVASINPAGIAEFRKSEYNLSIGVPVVNSKATLSGNTVSQKDIGPRLDNIGAVFFYDPYSFNVKSLNLAIGANKLADFNRQLRFSGTSNGTIVERFLEVASGLSPEQLDSFDGGLAYDAGAIYNYDGNGNYEADFITLDENVQRAQAINTSGAMHEIFITMGSNIKNKLSYGFTLGIPIVNLSEVKSYTENDINNNVDFFDEIAYDQSLSVRGAGINLKAGVIYKINLRTRVALAVHSPSWLFMQEEYFTDLDYNITSSNGPEAFTASSPLSSTSYQIRTPFRAIAGLSHIYSLSDEIKGFISADAEYVDYSSINFSEDPTGAGDPIDQFVFRDLNDEAKNTLTQAFNFRLGSELAFKKARVRLGVNVAGPVTQNNDWVPQPGFAFGLGFRGDKIYVDVSANYQTTDQNYTPYRLLNPSREQLITAREQNLALKLSFGTKI